MINVTPWCIATVVSEDGLDALLESSERGSLKDTHPWFVASELFQTACEADQSVAILFADGDPIHFTHWAVVVNINVQHLSGDRYESKCDFDRLVTINPIFEPLDSVNLMPSQEQLYREQIEPIRVYRVHVEEAHLRPYAICETPAFVNVALETGM